MTRLSRQITQRLTRSRRMTLATLGALTVAAVSPLAASRQIDVRVEAGKETFFEGEPIYVAVRTTNRGSDTAWVMPPQFGRSLEIQSSNEHGVATPVVGVWIDGIVDATWRGRPLAPGESTIEITLLQDHLGFQTSKVFSAHLGIGRYQVSVRYAPGIPGAAAAGIPAVESPVIAINVRPRSATEEALFRDVERVRELAWDQRTQDRYMRSLEALTKRVYSEDRQNSFLPFLLVHGVVTARVLPRFDLASAARIAPMRLEVMKVQRDNPSGAWVALSLVADREIEDTELFAALGSSLSAEVARDGRRKMPRPDK